jgi:argininosuccinate lyase
LEFGYLRLADGFVQTSSIMPQKRNPVALEHARAIASKALGQASAIILAVHNTPFGDVVDTEDDLQPLVFATFRDATRVVKLVAAALSSAEFDTERLEARAAEGWTTLTELADTLVRDHSLPFRSAHAVASALVSRRAHDPVTPLSELLIAASDEISGKQVRYTENELAEILSPRHFVDVRRTYGGPSPVEVDRALDQSRDRLMTDQRWWADAMDALKGAEQRLAERTAGL